MYDPGMDVLANFWNQRVGRGHRRIKVTEDGDGRLTVTLQVGAEVRPVLATGDPAVALAGVRELIESSGFPVAEWIDQAVP